jgi:hypothetical protein
MAPCWLSVSNKWQGHGLPDPLPLRQGNPRFTEDGATVKATLSKASHWYRSMTRALTPSHVIQERRLTSVDVLFVGSAAVG